MVYNVEYTVGECLGPEIADLDAVIGEWKKYEKKSRLLQNENFYEMAIISI